MKYETNRLKKLTSHTHKYCWWVSIVVNVNLLYEGDRVDKHVWTLGETCARGRGPNGQQLVSATSNESKAKNNEPWINSNKHPGHGISKEQSAIEHQDEQSAGRAGSNEQSATKISNEQWGRASNQQSAKNKQRATSNQQQINSNEQSATSIQGKGSARSNPQGAIEH